MSMYSPNCKFKPWNRLRRATGGRPLEGAGRYTQ